MCRDILLLWDATPELQNNLLGHQVSSLEIGLGQQLVREVTTDLDQ